MLFMVNSSHNSVGLHYVWPYASLWHTTNPTDSPTFEPIESYASFDPSIFPPAKCRLLYWRIQYDTTNATLPVALCASLCARMDVVDHRYHPLLRFYLILHHQKKRKTSSGIILCHHAKVIV